jgi:8-oxo-dGTP pyrophosphatase MutT (NUDIX family)
MKKWNKFLIEDITKTSGIVVCLNGEQQFLVIRRSDIDDRAGQWTMPGGHVDSKDCTIEHGAARELEEEANLTCDVCDLVYLGQPKPEKFFFMTQKWSGEVDVDKPNPESGEIEHDDWKWVTINEIKEMENIEIPIYLLEKALEISKNDD